jgi:hypothetical protein
MQTSVTPNGKSVHVSPYTEQEFDQRFNPLAEQWQAQDKRGLEMRFALGVLLNEHIGPPTTRTKRGQGVVAKVSESLKTNKFEVSRVRNFANKFKSIADFVEQHPGVTTWSGVKGLLPRLKSQEEGQGDGTKAGSGNEGAMKDPTPKKMEHHLKRFSEELHVVRGFLSREELENLKCRINGILEQVQYYQFQLAGALAAQSRLADSIPQIDSLVR